MWFKHISFIPMYLLIMRIMYSYSLCSVAEMSDNEYVYYSHSFIIDTRDNFSGILAPYVEHS